MKKYLFFLIIAIVFCSSCQHKASNKGTVTNDTIVEEPAFRVINFTENLTDCGKPLVLSDIVDDVEYLKLETTEKGFIAGIEDVNMSGKYIILTSFMVDHALLFDRVTGKFIRTIGKVGQGPGELLSPCYVGIQNDSIVYISSTYTYALFAHKITGEFIKKIPLEPNVQYPNMNFIDDYIIHYPGNANITGLYANVYVQDWDGNVIQESVHQFPGKFTENLWLNSPIVWTYKGIHNAFSCATDTVYAVTKDSIYPRYYIPEGKYKREICDRHTKVNWDFFTDAIQMGSIAETRDFLLFSFDLHQKYWFCRYNKHNSEIDIWKQDSTEPTKAYAKKPVGITNDIDGYNLSLAGFRYIDDRHFVRFITPDNADEIKKIVTESTNVKFPEKRQQLLELIDSLGPDDNPILAIYKLKD